MRGTEVGCRSGRELGEPHLDRADAAHVEPGPFAGAEEAKLDLAAQRTPQHDSRSVQVSGQLAHRPAVVGRKELTRDREHALCERETALILPCILRPDERFNGSSADDSSLFPTVTRPHDSVGVVGVSS
jgi:hypothetical protein